MIPDQPDWMTEHEKRDDDRFQDQKEHTDKRFIQQNEIIAGLATKKDLEALATKKDMEQILSVYQAFMTASKVISNSSSWIARFVPALAGVIIGVSIITGAWRTALAWAAKTFLP